MKIKLSLNPASINAAIRELEEYKKSLSRKADQIGNVLAELGYSVAVGIMSGHVFSGETLDSLTVERQSEGKYVLYAQSKALLFFEFGAGARYGYGHPKAGELGFGPGTYPGAGHWNDPNGWWFPADDPRLIRHTDKSGQGWGHSYGNQPYMPMYNAAKDMRAEIERVAREVFAT